jgi:hypothetical protein
MRSAVPVFWGYLLAAGMADLGSTLLDSSLMPVVFDLDETLLQASSLSQLKTRIDNATRAKCAPGGRTAGCWRRALRGPWSVGRGACTRPGAEGGPLCLRCRLDLERRLPLATSEEDR